MTHRSSIRTAQTDWHGLVHKGVSPFRYRLSPHVHACRTHKHVVLLDVKRDQYVGIGGAAIQELADVIEGWPAAHHSPTSSIESESTSSSGEGEKGSADALREMLDTGMVTTDTTSHYTPRTTPIVEPRTALIDGYTDVSCSVGMREIRKFLAAAAATKFLLRWKSFENVVAHIKSQRDLQRTPPDSHAARFDLHAARQRVAEFKRLRTFIYTANDACLFDSLTLSKFLFSYGIYPNVVFGVDTNPFAAHCWLQEGSIVINDDPLDVSRYVPVLII